METLREFLPLLSSLALRDGQPIKDEREGEDAGGEAGHGHLAAAKEQGGLRQTGDRALCLDGCGGERRYRVGGFARPVSVLAEFTRTPIDAIPEGVDPRRAIRAAGLNLRERLLG